MTDSSSARPGATGPDRVGELVARADRLTAQAERALALLKREHERRP